MQAGAPYRRVSRDQPSLEQGQLNAKAEQACEMRDRLAIHSALFSPTLGNQAVSPHNAPPPGFESVVRHNGIA